MSNVTKFSNGENAISERPAFIVEPMKANDIDAVAIIERRSNTLPWNPNAYATELGNTNAHYLIAREPNGTIIGFGGIWVIIDELHITTIAVDPNYRGLRIGEQLLHAMMVEGIRRGATRATLEVRQSNAVAQGLYHKYRFEDVAIRKAYYSDNGENAIIMWAEDLATAEYQQILYRYRQDFQG